MQLDPRIGMLNSGKFYCFPNGHLDILAHLKEGDSKS